MSAKRFVIEAQENETECECPPSLCQHPTGVRFYEVWIVWDTERDDNAGFTTPAYFADFYDLRRDARAAIRRFNEAGAG